MADAPLTEVCGRGWRMSVQRLRPQGEPGRSPNLGAAPLSAAGDRPDHFLVRLAAEERFWIAVIASAGLRVTACSADGRAIVPETLDDAAGSAAIHRFARLDGSTVEGIGGEDMAAGDDDSSPRDTFIVAIGSRQISLTVLAASDFDARFGTPPRVEGEPAVYEGWRLP